MKTEEQEKIIKAVFDVANNACDILSKNYKTLLEITPQKAMLINEMVTKNFSLYSSQMSDKRAKLMKFEIIEFWRTATPFKIVSQTMILEKFAEVWRGLKKSKKFHFQIDFPIFRMLLANRVNRYIGEIKLIEFCHLDENIQTFEYDETKLKSYLVAQMVKNQKRETNNENNNVKNEIEK